MKDKFGREIDYLRVSVTDNCNLRCIYCMDEKNNTFLKGDEKLTDDEIYKVIKASASLGIKKIRITGGEPFLEFENMCKMIKYSENKLDVSKIISNGFWGNNVEYYFQKLEESKLFTNQFFVPTIQISIGEQTVPLEDICNIINYVSKHYTRKELNFGVIHTRLNNLGESQLSKLYKIYLEKLGKMTIYNRYSMVYDKFVYETDNIRRLNLFGKE